MKKNPQKKLETKKIWHNKIKDKKEWKEKIMKIRLQSGKTIEDALLTAVECLKENEENYQMEKGCATL